jgi:predicted O-methyltransferase YrrM
MKRNEERHKKKFLKIFKNEFQKFRKPVILEFGVSSIALSTSIFLDYCKKNKGMLYSVDVNDYSYHFKSKNWKFIKSRDDNFDYIKKQIPKKFDIIYLDTIHKADHVKKMIYYYFDKLKKGGLFVIDDTSMLPYLQKREKNNFFFERNNQETFETLLKILNSNHKELDFETSFIGTGAVKLTKLSNKRLKLIKPLFDRKFSFSNLIRKIYLILKTE